MQLSRVIGAALLLQTHRVNGQLVLACIILQRCSGEAGGEVEATDPEHRGLAVVIPVLQCCVEGPMSRSESNDQHYVAPFVVCMKIA
jgi:hypothetical protein